MDSLLICFNIDVASKGFLRLLQWAKDYEIFPNLGA